MLPQSETDLMRLYLDKNRIQLDSTWQNQKLGLYLAHELPNSQ